jgi:outer membrane protein insertion porin family
MVSASRESAAISLINVRPLVPLILVLVSTTASPAQILQGDLDGQIVTRIDFDPVAQPLPREELDRRMLPLKTGAPLRTGDVRAAIQALYDTGRFKDISVDAQREGAGVILKISTELTYFVSRVTIDGAAEPPNREQIVAATKLELGGLFEEAQMARAVQNIQERLRANGFYHPQVSYQADRNSATEEVSIFFEIHTGTRARFDGVNLLGSFSRTPESVIRQLGWHRGLGPLMLPGWRELTEPRVQSGLSHVQDGFQKGDHLEARVTLGELNIHDDTNRVTPTVKVEEGPIIDVSVPGVKISKGRLRQLIPIFQERAVDRGLLVEGQKNLLDYFQSQGYFDAQLEEAQQSEPSPGHTVIEFGAMLGSRHKLVNIDISGNRYFDSQTLRERLSMTPATFIRHNRGSFSQGLLDGDIATLLDLYHANGFPDAMITSMKLDDYKGKVGDLSVRLEVTEGAQRFINSLVLDGVADADARYLRTSLESAAGQPFSESSIATDRDSVLTYYFNNGYPDATFDWTQTPGPTPNRVDLKFVVKPGTRQFVRRVLVRGLDNTRAALVANRISLSPGDPISQSKISDSQQKLYDLGIFSKVQTALQNPDGEEDQKYVLFQLTEASKYSFNVGVGAELARIGGGVTTFDAPAGTTGFSPRATLGVTRLNFLGLGHTVGVQTLFSTLEQRVLFSYQAPQFTGNRNLALTFSALFDDASDIRTFTSHRLEGSVQLSERVSRQYSLQYRYTIRRVTIPLDSLKITPELVPLLSQPDRAGLVSMSFVQDRRDDPVDSHRGVYNTVDLGYAWSGLGSGTNYTRISARNASYHRIGHDMVLAQGTQFGWIHNLGGMPIDIPLAERFFSGGSSTDRAFPDNQAGPRDIGSPISLPTGFPLGGNALLFHSTELRFPLIGNNLGGVLFHDIGNVYADLAGMSFRFRQQNIQDFNYAVNSFGFGIRYRTPIGPIRVDFSLSPDSPRFFGFSGTRDQLLAGTGVRVDQRLNIFQFHFSLGQTF